VRDPVVIEGDTKPRAVAVPDGLNAALAKHGNAKATFEDLAPSHKKAYVDWIAEAKRPETRTKRVREAVAAESRRVRGAPRGDVTRASRPSGARPSPSSASGAARGN
jgi:hypothetical protein